MNAHPAYPKELADTIAKSIERIRNGEYEKALGAYHTKEHNYCAVGIVLDNSGLGEWKQFATNGSFAYVPHGEELSHLTMFGTIENEFLPLFGLTQSGLIDKVDVISGVYLHGTSLVEMNDVDGWSLDEIADRMEECLTCKDGWSFVNPATHKTYLTDYLEKELAR
jgi:hypothetical protein